MNEFAIVPRPASVRYEPGIFQCSGIPEITGDGVFQREMEVFACQLREMRGETAPAVSAGGQAKISLSRDENSIADAYRLGITSKGISLSAACGAGIYHGLQTLRQLFLSGYTEGNLTIPCGLIEDHPRFPWRGFMLDCSRYFYSVAFIKKLLDRLSLHHLNIFHWHLTDDQGWRMPVKSYPLLTEIGSRRQDHRYTNRYTGGFYTADDIRAVVAFAAARHIEVVPEVDLPGHASAILAAYPGLGCTGGPYRVEDRFGVFDEVLCAGNDGIFPLAEAVFTTLTELFPSKYVHIGGDEVRFGRWEECPRCRARQKALGLSAPGELQSWITSALAGMLKEKGKTAIGWDETLENTDKFPLPEDLIIMSWRGREGGDKAAGFGHRVIMTPNTEGCYLDYKQSDDPEEPGQLGTAALSRSYAMDPGESALGGQGNLWSELIYAGKFAEYMIFPRICALAESFWTPRENKDFADFQRRLPVHQARLDRLGVLQYR
jgi:hexosaminidase